MKLRNKAKEMQVAPCLLESDNKNDDGKKDSRYGWIITMGMPCLKGHWATQCYASMPHSPVVAALPIFKGPAFPASPGATPHLRHKSLSPLTCHCYHHGSTDGDSNIVRELWLELVLVHL